MEHGTLYAYRKRGCRCEKCRGANREYGRAWREAHPKYAENWREEHPGYAERYAKRWREENPDYGRQWDRAHPERRLYHYQWVQTVKAAQGCCLCGEKEGTLIHHHVDPATKRYGVSQMCNMTLEAIIDEVDKCVVLCKHCHDGWHSDERWMSYAKD